MKKITTKKQREKIYCALCAIFFIATAWAISNLEIPQKNIQIENNIDNRIEDINKNIDNEKTALSTLKISYIDVGQADCILIQNENKNMLIDAGNNADGDKLVKYFNSLGIKEFEIVVGTHPHEDHIGGLDDVINSFNIGTIYMPNVLTTTATFEDVLDAIDNRGLKVSTPKEGNIFDLGDCKFEILSVGNDSDDLNSCSIVLKLNFYDKSFIFTGDATSENEQQMLSKDICADVLKVRTSWL